VSATPRTDPVAIKRLRTALFSAHIEISWLTVQRDEARLELVKQLKNVFTAVGLRRELKQRGWWEWYKEAKKSRK